MRWFDGGKLNVAVNCVDRHVAAGHGDQVAYHFEGEPGDTRDITYAELLTEVSQAANALESLGVTAGDRVAIYLPMIPEAAVAMLACARIGAVHSVVFGGFSAEALRSRIEDAEAVLVITERRRQPQRQADGAQAHGRRGRRGVAVGEERPRREAHRPGGRVDRQGRLVARPRRRASRKRTRRRRSTPSTRSSSSTRRAPPGKPKGILHTTGGYLTQVAYTHRKVFDLKPDTDVYWCTADIGWVTGHSYVVYGPLANRATSLMYEGTPGHPAQRAAGGSWSRSTASRSSTPRRPRSARS